jgi:transposase
MNKLTQEQVDAIPIKLQTMTQRELAKEWGKSVGSIAKWVRKLKEAGVKLPEHYNKIIIKNETK